MALWRSPAVPHWVPILQLSIVATFLVPTSGLLGLIAELLVTVASIATGYYAWRRASRRPSSERT